MGFLIDEVMRHSIGIIDPPHVVTGHAVIEYLYTLLPEKETDDIPLLFNAPQRLPWAQTWVEFPLTGGKPAPWKKVRGVLTFEIDGAEFRLMAAGGPLPRRLPPIAREWIAQTMNEIRHSKGLAAPVFEGYDRAYMFHFSVCYSEEQPERPAGYSLSARDRDGIILSDGVSAHGDKNIYTLALTNNHAVAEHIMACMDIAHMIIALFHVRGMERNTRRNDERAIQARLRRKRPVTVEYTTISFPGVQFGSAREERERQGVIPAHLVRGHFADYTGGRGLFGRRRILVWKPAHVRGNSENGVVLSEHTAKPPAA